MISKSDSSARDVSFTDTCDWSECYSADCGNDVVMACVPSCMLVPMLIS